MHSFITFAIVIGRVVLTVLVIEEGELILGNPQLTTVKEQDLFTSPAHSVLPQHLISNMGFSEQRANREKTEKIKALSGLPGSGSTPAR